MAGEYTINIEKGSDTQDVSLTITNDDGSPVSLNGYTAAMQIRKKPGGDILDTLTTENTRITIVEETGIWTVTLKFPSTVSNEYSFNNASYDFELIDAASLVDRVLQGSVFIEYNITV